MQNTRGLDCLRVFCLYTRRVYGMIKADSAGRKCSLMQESVYRDEPRLELIDGKVRAMSPAFSDHNRVAGNIFGLFWQYLLGKRCVPFGDNQKVFLTEKDHFVPDVQIVCDRDKIRPDGIHGAPDLVVEVLSRSTSKRDKTYKKDVYEASGVPEYWIVSPNERIIDVYRLRDGRYALHDVYAHHEAWELEAMSEEERASLVKAFKCHLYDDLLIPLDVIFYGLS